MGSSVATRLLASSNAYPRIPWLHEAWLATVNRYERIATASPRLGMGILNQELVQCHINKLPTLRSLADFHHVFDGHGVYLGSRPKTATWPLAKGEAMSVKEWAA